MGEKRKKRRNVIESDDDEDDSDIPIGRNRKLKSRKCRDEFSEEYSSSDTEKSSSSSESNNREENISDHQRNLVESNNRNQLNHPAQRTPRFLKRRKAMMITSNQK